MEELTEKTIQNAVKAAIDEVEGMAKQLIKRVEKRRKELEAKQALWRAIQKFADGQSCIPIGDKIDKDNCWVLRKGRVTDSLKAVRIDPQDLSLMDVVFDSGVIAQVAAVKFDDLYQKIYICEEYDVIDLINRVPFD